MRYLLDANIWSKMARAERNAGVVQCFERKTNHLAMPAPVADELSFRVERLADGKRRTALRAWLDQILIGYPVVPFAARAAVWHGAERARRQAPALGQPSAICRWHDSGHRSRQRADSGDSKPAGLW